MSALRLGVIIPCRNEAAVIERKLANLAGIRWPVGEHVLVVVDDGSNDATADLARATLPRLKQLDARLIDSLGPPGKSGAVRTACAALAGVADILVVTDADVILEQDALLELTRAFAADPRLLLACGAQQFVRDLTSRAPLDHPVDHPYDRVTALVRALESRRGKLFSVHGQLAAWRAHANLLPAAGRPADDLDLMFAARRMGGRVRLIGAARFLEEKVERDDQAVRRARAYFEALRGRRRPLGEGWFDRLQWSFYRRVPGLTPALLLPLRPALRLTRRGRRLVRLLEVMRTARLAEARAPLSDRWEMQRS